MSLLPSYTIRAVRRPAFFPLEFFAEGKECVRGTCENLSESGLLALFEEAVDIWTRGTVNLSFGAGLLDVHVRVARVEGLRAGLAFHDMDDYRRRKVRELMESGDLPDHL